MEEKMEKMISDEKIINNLLLGQKLRLREFKKISLSDLEQLLKCKEISKMENDLALSKKVNELKEKDYVIHKIKTASYYPYPYIIEYIKKKSIFSRIQTILVPKIKCILQYVPLNQYMESEIPEEVILQINHAIEIGITKFFVVYPYTYEIKNDPIIIGIFPGTTGFDEHGFIGTVIFIAQWN